MELETCQFPLEKCSCRTGSNIKHQCPECKKRNLCTDHDNAVHCLCGYADFKCSLITKLTDSEGKN